MLAARKTSIPAPEPRSTIVSPSLIKANFVGVPHPAPPPSSTDTVSPVDLLHNNTRALIQQLLRAYPKTPPLL
jgi:hypothetical protein